MLGTRDDQLVAAVLDNWRTAPVPEKVRRTLGFLEKVTLSPGEVTPQDAKFLKSAGITDRAIEEALYVCLLFNLMDRLADALDFHMPSAAGFQQGARMLYNFGYWTGSIPG